MKRFFPILLFLMLGIVSFAGDPVKPLPAKAQAYIDKVQQQTRSEYDARHITDNESLSSSFKAIRGTKSGTKVTFDERNPEAGVQVWFVVSWYRMLDNDVPTGEEIEAEFNCDAAPGAIAYGAACALYRGCPLTIGLKPDRFFEETGLHSSITLTHEELIAICSSKL